MGAVEILGIFGVIGLVASRYFILRALRTEAPREFFIELGAPTFDQLSSRAFDPSSKKVLQSRFDKFIWKGEFLRMTSRSIQFWGAVVVLSNLSVVAALCVLLYQEFQ